MKMITDTSMSKYIENFVASSNALFTAKPLANLRADKGVLYCLDQPIAIKTYDFLLVDSATHTLTTNLAIIEVKAQCAQYDMNPIELNFREASYLLTGVWDTAKFVDFMYTDFEGTTNYVVEGNVYVLESDTMDKALVVGRTSLALKEFELFLGVADGRVAIETIYKAFDNVAYRGEGSFFIGNLLLNKEEHSLEDLPKDLAKTTGITDICTLVLGGDELYAVGRINHKWYPKRLELDRYYSVEVLPLRYIK